MSIEFALVNGLVVTEREVLRGGVYVRNGRIDAVGDPDTFPADGERIDLAGNILMPGAIDPHVHLGGGDIPGMESLKEDAHGATRDALLGGMTSLVTTTPFLPDPLPELLSDALDACAGRAWCDYNITSVVLRESQIAGIEEVISRGVASFKFFPGYIGPQAESLGMDPAGLTPATFYQACEAMAKTHRPVLASIHAEEPYVRALLGARARTETGSANLRRWEQATPEWAESAQVLTYGSVASSFGIPLYVVHVSAGQTVTTIQFMQNQGMAVIGESLPAFLCGNSAEFDSAGLGGRAKIQPPVRSAENQQALWHGLLAGTLSVIGTDSVNYSRSLKDSSDFWTVRPGANLQLADALPLMFSEGVVKRRMSLTALARIMAGNAARAFGLYPSKGVIQIGSDADLTVIDPNRELTLGAQRYESGADYSIWQGKRVSGAPVKTFLRGRLVMENDEIVASAPSGQRIKAGTHGVLERLAVPPPG